MKRYQRIRKWILPMFVLVVSPILFNVLMWWISQP